MIKVGALFAGIGGIELGLEKAKGFQTTWFVENEPYAQAVLRKHWPGVPIYGDIRQIDFTKIERVDMLTGGFPCQDISNAGNRKGITGERSGLWKEYLRAISEIRPRYALIENVSALRNRGLDTLLCDLAEVGYDAEWNCIPASAIGAPHRRDRIFILAFPSDCGGKQWRTEREVLEGREARLEVGGSGSNVADSDNWKYWKQRKESLREKNRTTTWATDAGILRVAHGIPNRIHRIKCLGNAVVPQVAEFIAEIIKQKEEGNEHE